MIIFINGSINAGKSTVAKILSARLPKSALIEIDVFHEMIEWMPIEEAIPLNLKNGLSVIQNFIDNGIDCIIPYPLSQKNYDYLNDELKDCGVSTYVFTLAPNLDSIMSRKGKRKLTDWEKNRIKHHYNIGLHDPKFGEIIDNTDKTPEETADIIMKKIKGKKL